MTTHILEIRCVQCGKAFNRQTGLKDDQPPIPGDLTFCIRCGTLMAFTASLGVRRACEPDLEGLQMETLVELLNLRRSIMGARR